MRAWKLATVTGISCLFLASSIGRAATIYACKKKIGGTVRIVGAKAQCLTTETKMFWNSIGPQGPQGQPGNLALAGQQCRGGQEFVGYDEAGNLKCAWTFFPVGLTNAEYRAYGFANADLRGSGLGSGDLSGVDFSNSLLIGAHDGNVKCVGANFSGAFLQDASFGGNSTLGAYVSDFRDAIFRDANLHNAQFRNVDLSGADFSNAVLLSAGFNGSNLSGAVFSGARWGHTTCPDGSMSDTNGSDPESCDGHMNIFFCGNHSCESDEDHSTCPADCYCSNGTCDVDETSATCSFDCP